MPDSFIMGIISAVAAHKILGGLSMYKLYENKPALAEQACESSINSELVYRCMQPIKCEHGTLMRVI